MLVFVAITIYILTIIIVLLLLQSYLFIHSTDSPTLNQLPPMIHRRIKLDKHFTETEKQEIIDALNIWKKITCGLFDFSVVDTKIDTLYVDQQYNEYNTIAFIRGTSNDNLIKKIDYTENAEIYGYAYHSIPNIVIVVPDRLKTLYDFKNIIIHEIGHLLCIGHVDDSKSIMHKYYTGHNKITNNDIIAFLSVCRWDYNCVEHTGSSFWIQTEQCDDKKRLKRFNDYKK